MGFFNRYLALYLVVATALSLFVGGVWSWGHFKQDFMPAVLIALAVYVPGFLVLYTALYIIKEIA